MFCGCSGDLAPGPVRVGVPPLGPSVPGGVGQGWGRSASTHPSLDLLVPPQTSMPGMKRDCGGAAAILGAFRAAVKQVSEISAV